MKRLERNMNERKKKQASADVYTKYYESKEERLKAEAVARATSGSWFQIAEETLKEGNIPELKTLKRQVENRLKSCELSSQEKVQLKSLNAIVLKRLEEQEARVAADKKLIKYLEKTEDRVDESQNPEVLIAKVSLKKPIALFGHWLCTKMNHSGLVLYLILHPEEILILSGAKVTGLSKSTKWFLG